MTPDEKTLLTRFLAELNAVKGVQKDPEAAAQIAQAMNTNPDAPYLLVQHAILADQALAAAQARIAELEDEVRRQFTQNQQGQDRGFLGGLFGGRHDPPPAPRPTPWGGAQPYTVVPQTAPYQGGGGFFSGGAPAQPGGMGSFLANAGATAAGVAGGAFLFEGLSNMFGGHHGGFAGPGFFGGGGDYGGGFGGPTEVVNNYYESGSDRGGGFADNGGGFGGGDYDAGNGDPGGDDYS